MKQRVFLDYANYYDINQRTGFLAPSNYAVRSRVYVERSWSETPDLGRCFRLLFFISNRIYHTIKSSIYDGDSYDANNVSKRKIGTYIRAEEIGLHSTYHITWWKVNLSGLQNINSIIVLLKTIQAIVL